MKKKSKYRPKGVRLDVMGYMLSGMKPLRDMKGIYLGVQLHNREALDKIRTGTATKDDIDRLIGAFNITEALAMSGLGSDWMPEINQAQDALLELARRGVDNGMRFIMTAKQWEAMKLMMELHEEQLANATVYDIEKAYDTVQKALRQKKVRTVIQPKKEST
jgi:hypothetical protein